MKRFFGLLRKKTKGFSKRMDQYQEAVTFAEAGAPGHAQNLFQEQVNEEQERPGRLLVVGRESAFSKEVIDYALEMAQRMSYEILALNTAPLSCETFKLFSSSRKQLCEDFRALSEKNAKDFQEKAERLGIPFTHVIRFSDRDEALEETNREFTDIEFVVSDAEEEREESVNRAEDSKRPSQPIYIYSLT